MSKRLSKKLYDPSDPKDAEELLNYLYTLDSEDEDYEVIKNSDRLDLALQPPDDGIDSDQDDAPSDGEVLSTVRDIGKGVLAQKMQVITVQGGEKLSLEEARHLKSNKEDSDSDLETLAEIQKRLKSERKSKKIKKKRNWTNVELTPRG